MGATKYLLTLLLLAGVTDSSISSRIPGTYVTITSLNSTEITVQPGENLTLTCESNAESSWEYPDTTDGSPIFDLTNQAGIYVSTLKLTNVTYRDVGYYNCTSKFDSDKYAAVYLFVKDEENLLTYSDILFVPVSGLQYHDIVIPCKPTHPAVKVDLCLSSNTKLIIGENDNFGVINYDHKKGFTLENAQTRNIGYYYCCVLPSESCDQDECSRMYSLDVLKHTDSVARPQIDEINPPHVTVGNNVTLACKVTVKQSIKFTLEWIGLNETDPRIIMEESSSIFNRNGYQYVVGENTLTILNVKQQDEGNYICQVTDHARNKNSEKKYLRIYS